MRHTQGRETAKLKIAAVSTAVAASLLAGTLAKNAQDAAIPDASQLAEPSSVVTVLEQPLAEPAEDEREKRRREPQERRTRAERWFQGLLPATRLLVLVPLWLLGKGLSVLAAGAVSAVGGPLAGVAVGAVADAAVLGATLTAGRKLLHPQTPVKELFSPTALTRVLFAAALLLLADAALPLVWPRYLQWRHFAQMLLFVILAAALWQAAQRRSKAEKMV